jgi:hypothetical protein
MPLRANVTSGPSPGGPGGRCGGTSFPPVTPGLIAPSAPNSSVWIAPPGRPSARSAPSTSAMNAAGPQM